MYCDNYELKADTHGGGCKILHRKLRPLLPEGSKLFIKRKDFQMDGFEFIWSVDKVDTGMFWITGVTGNCGIVTIAHISKYNVEVKRVADTLLLIAETTAKLMNFSVVECTAQKRYQDKFIKIAKANGYKEIYEFVNKRTQNTIVKLVKEI